MSFRPLLSSYKFIPEALTSIPLAIQSGVYITPVEVTKAYNIPSSTGFGVTIGVISLGGGFLQSDLDKSMSDLGLQSPSINFISISSATNNFNADSSNLQNPVSFSIENTLDIFCIASMVPDATINIYIASPNFSVRDQIVSDFNAAVQQATNDGCDIIAISWGTDELGDNAQPGGDVFDTVFATAEASGITIFVASGDYGSFNPVVDNSVNKNLAIAPLYPASSSRVVAVGGTYLTVNSDGSRNTEYAAQNSGGGISRIIPVPQWQNNLIYNTYPVTTPTTLIQYQVNQTTRIGRGVPDLSAPFFNYVFYFNGSLITASGTSASCPVIAGMFARFIAMNHKQRPSYGASTFMSKLYANMSTAFYNKTLDKAVTLSGQPTNNNAAKSPYGGYLATANSWNPVTGLGVPNGRIVYRLTGISGQTFPYKKSSRPTSGIAYPR